MSLLDNPRKIDQELFQAMIHNSHIADAQGAGDFTLCIYLMKLRELYRWEVGSPITDHLSAEELGEWITCRESLWDEIEKSDYQKIPIGGQCLDRFDNQGINASLKSRGLYYSAGLGQYCRANFMLAELEEQYERSGYTITICGREWVRGFTAPLAMTQGKHITIRKEAIKRYLWEKVEEWGWKQPDSAMGRAIAHYEFETNQEMALEQMLADLMPVIINHEVGEFHVHEKLGPGWSELIISLPRSSAHLIVRAVGDFLADALVTLPDLLQKGFSPMIHFYFGNLPAMHKELVPGLWKAYTQWQRSRDLEVFQKVADRLEHHWTEVSQNLLQLTQNKTCEERVELVESLSEEIKF